MCPNSSAASPVRRTGRAERDSWGRALRLAEEERQWRALVRHLPENARLLWEALDHLRQFQRVLYLYGGQNLRVPSRLPDPATPCAAPWARAACASSWPPLAAPASMCPAATPCSTSCANKTSSTTLSAPPGKA